MADIKKSVDIGLGIKQQGGVSPDKIAGDFEKADKSAKELNKTLDTLEGHIRKIQGDVNAATDRLGRMLDRQKVSINQVSRNLASGGPQASLVNSQFRGIQEQIKAAERLQTLELARKRQDTPSTNRAQLEQQIEAQKLRTMQASEAAREREEIALRRLNSAHQSILELEKAENRERRVAHNLTDRINDERNEGLRDLRSELSILQNRNRLLTQSTAAYRALDRERRAAAVSTRIEQANDPLFQTLNTRLSRDTTLNRLRTGISTNQDAEVRSLKDQAATQQKILTTERSIEAIQERIASARRRGDVAERAKLMVTREAQALELQRLRSNGQITAELQRQEQRYERVRAAAANAHQAETARGQQQRIDRTRNFREDLLFSDGGASLFRIQAQLLANYMLMGNVLNSIQFSAQFITDLDKAFYNLQAITATTNTEMSGLRDTLVDVSTLTKFTAVEVAEAATTLGQAGFSVQQIKDSIEAITLLATATGTDLQTSVDLVTSTISVFNMQAGEAADVANTFTSAINNSKLTIDKLTLGIQYAGNLAAQSGVSFQELAASLGAMANAGIRSGSMMGTGLRVMLTSFISPSEKMQMKLKSLGLTMEDVNVETQGLSGVLHNLREAGFNAADAMETMEIRAGAAYIAAAENVEEMERLRRIFTFSQAAIEANATQMESLANKMDRAKSVFGTFVNDAFEPLVDLLKVGVDGFSELLDRGNGLASVFGFVTQAVVAFFSVLAIKRIGLLTWNVLQAGTAFKTLGEFAKVASANLTGAAAATTRTTTVMSRLGSVGLAALRGLPGLLALVIPAIFSLSDAFGETTDRLDEYQAAADEATGRFEKKRDAVEALTEEVERLTQRSSFLEESSSALSTVTLELQQKFRDWGLVLDQDGESVDSLIGKLEGLRMKLNELSEADLVDILSSQRLVESEINARIRDQAQEMDAEGNQRELIRNLNPGRGASGTLFFGQPAEDSYATAGVDGAIAARLEKMFQGVASLRNRIPETGNLTSAQTGEFREDILRQRSTLVQTLDQITQRNPEFISAAGGEGNVNLIEDAVRQQLSALNGLESNVLKLSEIFEKQNQTNRDARLNTFNQSAAVSQARGSLTGPNGLEAQLVTARQAFRQASTIEGKRSAVENIKNLEDTVAELRSNLIRAASEAGLSDGKAAINASQARILNEFDGDIQKALVEFNSEIGETEVKLMDRRAQTLRRRAKEIADSTDENDRPSQIRSAQETIRQIYEEVYEVERRKLMQKMREEGKDVFRDRATGQEVITDIGQGRLTDLRENINQEMAQSLVKYNELLEDNVRVQDDILQSSERFASQLTALGRMLQKFNEEQEAELNQMRNRRSAMDLNQFSPRYSDVERRMMSDRITSNETTNMANRAANNRLVAGEIERRRQELLQAELGFQTEAVNAENVLNNPDASTAAKKKAQTDLQKSREEVKKLQEEESKYLDQRNKLLREANELEYEVSTRQGENLQENVNLWDQLRYAVKEYNDSIGLNSSLTTNIMNSISQVFESAGSSFGDFVSNIATGTQSVGDSFRSMATSILKSMADIAAQKAGQALFGMLLDFAIGALGNTGTYNTVGNTPAQVNGGMSGGGFAPGQMNDGGLVRRASGGVTPLRTRDSVPILARPGEYVLRNSAVDAIGRDNLDMINAFGNRAINSSVKGEMSSNNAANNPGVLNIWVVSKDEVPQMGPKDVIAYVADDIARGGTTKKLIKSVQMGTV